MQANIYKKVARRNIHIHNHNVQYNYRHEQYQKYKLLYKEDK